MTRSKVGVKSSFHAGRDETVIISESFEKTKILNINYENINDSKYILCRHKG